jgi:hypothetical protein
MSNRKFALLCALPLLWSPLAFAQQAPSAGQPEGQPPMQHHMMHEGQDGFSPQEMCADHYARQAAHLAYLEAKLKLTDKQRPAWQKWQQWELDAASKEQAACLEGAPKGDAKPTALERESRMEKFLSIRLQGMQAARPALEALYDTLSPEQKAIFDRPHFMHGHGGMGPMHH